MGGEVNRPDSARGRDANCANYVSLAARKCDIAHDSVAGYIWGMIDLIQKKYDDLIALCRKFNIERLDLFGSAATGHFNPETSDLDFIIEFEDRASPGLLGRYLDFAQELERLFGRHVDLLTPRSMRNPFFRAKVNHTREKLYDRRASTAHL